MHHKQNYENQYKFEQQLILGQIDMNVKIDTSYLQAAFSISADEAHCILDCCYRKGLIIQSNNIYFSANHQKKQNISSVYQFTEKSGLKPKNIVRSVELIKPDKPTIKILQLSGEALIYQQKRTRLINDSIVANQCNYIPQCVTPGLEKFDLTNHSFQVLLEDHFHARVHTIREEYSLTYPSDEDCEILKLQRRDKIISVSRLSLSSNRKPLVWADIHVNPIHYSLVQKLWPQAKSLVEKIADTL